MGFRPASAPGSHTTGSLGLSRFSGWRVWPNALVGSPQSCSLGFPAAGTGVNTVPVDLPAHLNNEVARCQIRIPSKPGFEANRDPILC